MFDTVDHSILENKLKAIGLDRNAIAWFDAYLTNMMQITDVGGIFSDPRIVPCGVPDRQTDILLTERKSIQTYLS